MSDAAVILVVDDNEDDIFVLRRAFRKAGIPNPIVVLTGGEEAIKYLEGSGKYKRRDEFPLPRLILLDLKMPCVDGFEVLSWIRGRRELAGIVILVLTSSLDHKDIQRSYELGANSFIAKDIEFENVVAMARLLKEYWLLTNKTYDVERPSQRASIQEEDESGRRD